MPGIKKIFNSRKIIVNKSIIFSPKLTVRRLVSLIEIIGVWTVRFTNIIILISNHFTFCVILNYEIILTSSMYITVYIVHTTHIVWTFKQSKKNTILCTNYNSRNKCVENRFLKLIGEYEQCFQIGINHSFYI